jgi:hypothetical protein
MTINELSAKQIAEMQDMLDLQGKEVLVMLKRHDRERQQQPAAYFEQRREQQLGQLKARHLIERERLAELHDKEYQDMRIPRSILHNAEHMEKAEQTTLNRKIEQKNRQEEPVKEKSILEKVREMIVRVKTKNREPEM